MVALGLVLIKIQPNSNMAEQYVDDVGYFSKYARVFDTGDYFLHFWKPSIRPSPQESNKLVTFILKEPNKGDIWVYALHKHSNSVVASAELAVYLTGKYKDMIGSV